MNKVLSPRFRFSRFYRCTTSRARLIKYRVGIFAVSAGILDVTSDHAQNPSMSEMAMFRH